MNVIKRVARAIQMLDDPTPAQEPLNWWRRGRTGLIHATRSCWRGGEWSTLDRVSMTLEEVASKRACSDCLQSFHRGSSLSNIDLNEALDLVSVESNILHARRSLAAGSASSISQALDLAARAKESLKEMPSADLCRTWRETLSKQADEAYTEAMDMIGTVRDVVLRQAASSFHSVENGRSGRNGRHTRWVTAAATEEQIERFGGSARVINNAHDTWVENVVDGKPVEEATQAAILGCESQVSLDYLSQLAGVTLDCPPGTDAGAAAKAAWSKKVRQDLVALTSTWQQQYEENLALHDTVTVAVSYDWSGRIHDSDVTAAMRAHPHAQGPSGFVANVPEVVWLWLSATCRGNSWRSQSTANSTSALETAAALWETEGNGPYRNFTTAVEAAISLA